MMFFVEWSVLIFGKDVIALPFFVHNIVHEARHIVLVRRVVAYDTLASSTRVRVGAALKEVMDGGGHLVHHTNECGIVRGARMHLLLELTLKDRSQIPKAK